MLLMNLAGLVFLCNSAFDLLTDNSNLHDVKMFYIYEAKINHSEKYIECNNTL